MEGGEAPSTVWSMTSVIPAVAVAVIPGRVVGVMGVAPSQEMRAAEGKRSNTPSPPSTNEAPPPTPDSGEEAGYTPLPCTTSAYDGVQAIANEGGAAGSGNEALDGEREGGLRGDSIKEVTEDVLRPLREACDDARNGDGERPKRGRKSLEGPPFFCRGLLRWAVGRGGRGRDESGSAPDGDASSCTAEEEEETEREGDGEKACGGSPCVRDAPNGSGAPGVGGGPGGEG